LDLKSSPSNSFSLSDSSPTNLRMGRGNSLIKVGMLLFAFLGKYQLLINIDNFKVILSFKFSSHTSLKFSIALLDLGLIPATKSRSTYFPSFLLVSITSSNSSNLFWTSFFIINPTRDFSWLDLSPILPELFLVGKRSYYLLYRFWKLSNLCWNSQYLIIFG